MSKSATYVLDADVGRPPPREFARILHALMEDQTDSIARTILHGFCAAAYHAEVFEFGDIDHSMLRAESVRAGKLMARNLLSTPFASCCYFYSVDCVTVELSEGADIIAAVTERGRFADRRRFCTLIYRDAELMENELPSYIVADFARAHRNEFPLIEAMQRARLQHDSVWTLESVGVFRSVDEDTFESVLLYELASLLCAPEQRPAVHRQASNSLVDGVAGLSMILTTRNIRTRLEPAPVRLNAKRAKRGKSLLPRVTHVDVRQYAEALRNAHVKGTHASPVPHLRRGHIRHYADGRAVWIRDALVNCRSIDELTSRERYEVEHD